MYITAHGGALRTGRNSKKFFEAMRDYPVDIVEVDVRSGKGGLYISHHKPLFADGKLSLEFVLKYARERGLMVNCDMKERGLVGKLLELAESLSAEACVIFTGRFCESDLPLLDRGRVYLNTGFFKGKCAIEPFDMKRVIDGAKNPRVLGVNLSYRFCSDGFLKKAEECGLKLSVYTVDDPAVIERLMQSVAVDNITTNIPDQAIKLRGANA
ncbi:MAG: glycerophosphodiester phosphodiesterase [Clostridiales bacterium]|jgi:glycerophosphoryl diester phosphodiesterase|nr:glycerophosphodiester phosphodiesterase [Clostridiales bacterium]